MDVEQLYNSLDDYDYSQDVTTETVPPPTDSEMLGISFVLFFISRKYFFLLLSSIILVNFVEEKTVDCTKSYFFHGQYTLG